MSAVQFDTHQEQVFHINVDDTNEQNGTVDTDPVTAETDCAIAINANVSHIEQQNGDYESNEYDDEILEQTYVQRCCCCLCKKINVQETNDPSQIISKLKKKNKSLQVESNILFLAVCVQSLTIFTTIFFGIFLAQQN